MADDKRQEMEQLLKLQRDAFTTSRPEPMSMRKDRIKRAMALLKEHGENDSPDTDAACFTNGRTSRMSVGAIG